MRNIYDLNIISNDETQKNLNYAYQISDPGYQPLDSSTNYQGQINVQPIKFSNCSIPSQFGNNYYTSNTSINRPTFYPFPDDLSKKYQTSNQNANLNVDTYNDENPLQMTRIKRQPCDSLFDNKSINSIVNFLPSKSEQKIRHKNNITESSGSSGGVYSFKNNIRVNNKNNSTSDSDVIFEKINKIEKINNASNIKNKQKSFEDTVHLNNTFPKTIKKKKKKNMNNNNKNCKNSNNENNDSTLGFKEYINNKLTLSNRVNQFINRNIATQKMLKEISFFERLKMTENERMKYFEQRYKTDYNFMGKEYFDNIFINERDIKNMLPLTLVFYYMFNPETKIKKLNLNKSFFESIFLIRGDTGLILNYKKSKLSKVPKYFNDLDYVKHLFNDFNEKELNSFLNEVDNWKNTFKFELQFVHTLNKVNIAKNKITMKDVARIYFVSPTDLIVDYHSFASDFPMSDKFISITQYRFHCDIKFNSISGKFEFKTSAVVYNKLQLIKKTVLENELINIANKNNEEELKINIWDSFRFIIESQSVEEKNNWDGLFQKNIEEVIKNYNEEIPKDSFIDNNNVENENINVLKKDEIQKKELISKINSEIKGGIQFTEKPKIKGEEIDKFVQDINNEDEEENKVISYGAFISFFLFILKTALSIEGGNISGETLLNIIIIIIIGKMLINVHFEEI